ncbi:hypothetical protein [Robbsia betulipollinis]|nr:hypothetical protein [Robbsia betulipollinis]
MTQGGELMTMLYLTYLFLGDELTREGLAIMVVVEEALQRAVVHDFEGEVARPTLDERACMAATLAEYDRLLRRTPTYLFAAARLHLQKLYTGDRVLTLAAVLATECDAPPPRDEERR